MRGGSYLVTRRIRISLEHSDRTEVNLQEEVIGRHKYSGAPLGGQNKFDALDLEAMDQDGNPVIAENAHVRLASREANDGARSSAVPTPTMTASASRPNAGRPGGKVSCMTRGYSSSPISADPRTGFIRIYENMSKLDAMTRLPHACRRRCFLVCPGGAREGEFIGQRLFESA